MQKQPKKYRLRKGRACVLALLMAACCFSILYGLTRSLHPLRLSAQSVVVDLDSSPDPKDWIASVLFGDADDVTIQENIDTSIPGNYSVRYLYRGYEQNLTVKVADTSAPVLTVKNVTVPVSQEVDPESFIVSCYDASRVKTTIANPESIRQLKAGQYDVQVLATDEFGNSTIEHCVLTRKELLIDTPVADENSQPSDHGDIALNDDGLNTEAEDGPAQ